MTKSNDVQIERLPLTPAMHARLTALALCYQRVLTLGVVVPAVLLLVMSRSTEVSWDLLPRVAVIAVLLTIAVVLRGVVLPASHSYQLDIADGVYCRATGTVVFERERRDERYDTLCIEGQILHAGWDLDRLRNVLNAREIYTGTRGVRQFTARAVVTYLPRSGTLLEVRNEAGALAYSNFLFPRLPFHPLTGAERDNR
jgi:hypothetical protein